MNNPARLIVLMLVCLLVAPQQVESQCTTSITGMTTLGSFMQITKMIAPAASCTTVAPMNAFGCGESPGMASATMLIASAFTVFTTNAQCNWVCNCPGSPMQMISITTSDGLPVELMDFAVEG